MGLDYADEDDDFHGYDERYYPRPAWTWPPGIESHAEVPSQVRGGGACVSSRGRCKGKNMDSGTLYLIGDGARRSGRPGPHGQVMGDRARYGVDGGYGGIPFFLLAETGLLAGAQWAKRRDKRLIGSLAMGGAAAVLGVAASYFYSTGPGKLSVWKDLLDELDLRGDELVLDIGCGRGAVLISAARRLHKGRATGADIWRLRDQTGNSRAAAQRNAEIEGVSERIELVNGDARDLPFPPESFDVVLSNLVFSNIAGSEERGRALREAVRVLRPGGQMRIVDDRADRYAPVLQGAGCVDVEVRQLDWRTWSGLPGHHFTLVSARKAAAGSRN
jgi:arsenite methyltransferase